LTSLLVEAFEQVSTVWSGTPAHWAIEVYFFVLKQGCQIDRLQGLETEERELPALALYPSVAWRVPVALKLGRTCPDVDCKAIFESCEWLAGYLVAHRCTPPTSRLR
jgi:hypothetical protein